MQQYKSNASSLVKQLNISFIQHSLERLDDDDRRDLIPIALQGCSGDEGQPRAKPFLHIILRLLLDARIPPRGTKDDEAFRNSIGFSSEADAKYMAKMIATFLRLRLPTTTQDWTAANPTFSPQDIELFSVDAPDQQKIYQRISELKAKLVTLLASGAFTDEEKFLPALYAASSFDTRVASTAEEIIKRSSVSMEDNVQVQRLFHAHSILPAAYRTRILGMLSKSSISTTMPEQIMKVVELDFMAQDSTLAGREALQPSSSLERTKLHKSLFQYLSWVARMGPSGDNFDIAPQLIKSMRNYVEGQGWPIPIEASYDDLSLRSRAYETIGLLARSADLSTDERLDLASWLFKSLSEDSTNDAVINIDGALSSLTASVPPSVGESEPRLKSLLLTYMLLSESDTALRSARHAAVKWANQCLSFSNVYARWINVLAIGGRRDERNEVIEQGRKGLDPWTYHAHEDSDPSLPDWKEMLRVFFNSEITPESVTDAMSLDLNDDVVDPSKDVFFQNFQRDAISAFPLALRYCREIMFLTALEDFQVEPDWMQKLDANVKTDIKTRQQIRTYLRSIDQAEVIFYLQACLAGAFLQDSPVVEECIRCFVDVASLSPASIMSRFKPSLGGILGLIRSNNKEIRHLGSKALGMVAAHPSVDSEEQQNLFTTLQNTFANSEKAIGSSLNVAEGSLVAFGHFCSRLAYYNKSIPSDFNFRFSSKLIADDTQPSLLEASLECAAQVWAASLFLPKDVGEEDALDIDATIKTLGSLAKKGNEKAISALGRLAIGITETQAQESGSELLSSGRIGAILSALFALHEIKRVEVQFTVGEAITAVIARWDSDFLKLTMDVESQHTGSLPTAQGPLVSAVLEKIFSDCKATKPSLLKASGIWLFCVVQYCAHLEEVQGRLREAQAAFMRLLNARDELVQETASRGLSLVYERGDADLKSTLVKDLVSAFTGSGPQLKVEEDTELFEPGALPTGEGKSVTSYKDIVNLANEVGDQRLVYKFMSLAANAATWSTRSAFGRFGLSNILGDSEVDPKLYPKLYRYRFDPNSNVQKSMDDIWKALVKDSGTVIDTHFDAILDDLLGSILGKEWRMRQASCAAIADLLSGRQFTQYEARYSDIWAAAYKVLDDVKGTVREAALKLCIALSTSLVRQLEESNNSSAANAMMKEALPFLLSDKGIESSVKDVQIFSTMTVMDIAKKGGDALKPFISFAVPQLLGLLSTIEPEQINYHYQRAQEERRDQIDKLRSQMVNRSPISEAIENCLRFIDATVMADLAPKLESTIKSAIGLPTKIGCSRVLTTLFTRHAMDVKQSSSKFLRMMEKQAMDKNDEVSQAYARASAYMMRVAPDSAKDRWCQKLQDMYFASEDESRRQKVADAVAALAKISSDHFTAHETQMLPFAYLGSHDTDDYVGKVFQEVWGLHAGSSRTVIRYVPEIVKLVEKCLDTQQWAVRHTGAFTVAALVADAAKASEATGEISEANLKSVWPVFDMTLALKTFPGKEKLLDSFPQLVEKGKSWWEKDAKVAAQLKKIAIREAKRNNDEYRVHAFAALWKFARARDDLDMYDDIVAIVTPHLDEYMDEDKMDVDSKGNLASKTARNGFEALARGYNLSSAKNEPLKVLSMVIKNLDQYLTSTKFGEIKREVWYDCVVDLMTHTKATSAAGNDDGLSLAYLKSLDLDTAETGVEGQRVRRAEAVAEVLAARKAGVFGAVEGDLAELVEKLKEAAKEERSLRVKEAWKQVLKELDA